MKGKLRVSQSTTGITVNSVLTLQRNSQISKRKISGFYVPVVKSMSLVDSLTLQRSEYASTPTTYKRSFR